MSCALCISIAQPFGGRVSRADIAANRQIRAQQQREEWQPPPEAEEVRQAIARLITTEEEAGR